MNEVYSPVISPNTRPLQKLGALTMTGLGALSLLAGCGGRPKPLSEYSDCVATHTEQWIPVPPDVNAARVADRLGQDIEEVLAGLMGTANCEHGISVDNIDAGAPVRLSGVPNTVSDRCLAIMSRTPTSPGAVAHEVGVLCPGE